MSTGDCGRALAPYGPIPVEEGKKCVYLLSGAIDTLDAARTLRDSLADCAPVTIAIAEIGESTTGRWTSKLAEVSSMAVPGSLLAVGEIVEKLLRIVEPGETQELGRHTFSDLSPPERVTALDVRFSYPERPGLKGLDLYDHNLPTLFDSFVGRDGLLEKVEQAIRASRIVTLTGCGGSGKTRLATHAAARILEDGMECCKIVYLSSVSDADGVDPSIAGQCGVAGEGVESVVEAYRSKSCLFVLDNCEHVLSKARSAILDLLAHIPRSQVIATSREALDIGGEIVIEVPPLPEAQRLFVERVQERRPEYDPDEAELKVIDEVCARVDGLPLAIEHAAGHSSFIGVHECLSRLKIGLQALRMDGEDRHRTMAATIAWSYDLLNEAERESAEVLAGFCSEFQLADAKEVLCSGSHDSLVISLVKKSVVVRWFDKDGYPWFHMLVPVREFLLERPSEVRAQRLRSYVKKLISEAYAYSEGEKTERDFRFLSRRYATVKSVLDEIVEAGDKQSISLCTKMTRYWTEHGPISDGIRLLTSCMHGQIGEYSPGADNALAVMLWMNGDFDGAEGLFNLQLREARKREDLIWVASALSNLGSLMNQRGEYAEARQHLEEAYDILHEAGDVPLWAKSAGNFANLLVQTGECNQAISIIERALAEGDGLVPEETVNTLRLNLSDALRLTADVVGCVETLGRLIESGWDQPATSAPAVLRISLLLCMTENYDGAARMLGVSKVLYEEYGSAEFAPRQSMVREIEDCLTGALPDGRWQEIELAGKLVTPEERLTVVVGNLRFLS
ncbi:MAG: tetratricopeptide repeat protein [Armatimonadetes bacterium]|nr:tetratricopeptide repeat protein [Armatimonadota bacterium]